MYENINENTQSMLFLFSPSLAWMVADESFKVVEEETNAEILRRSECPAY